MNNNFSDAYADSLCKDYDENYDHLYTNNNGLDNFNGRSNQQQQTYLSRNEPLAFREDTNWNGQQKDQISTAFASVSLEGGKFRESIVQSNRQQVNEQQQQQQPINNQVAEYRALNESAQCAADQQATIQLLDALEPLDRQPFEGQEEIFELSADIQQQQQTPDSTTMLNNTNNQDYTLCPLDQGSSRPYVEIVEQPAKCALRFRYKCEGRSAGSLPGANSSADNKTFPAIRIHNYVGKAVVVISCVTKDVPYKTHPHNIVGKEGCKKGICTIVLNNEPDMVRTFSSLGIQCVKRKDIEDSLSLRESIKVDPYREGFSHKLSASNIDLNVVRLCFQVFITSTHPEKCDFPLIPVVSDPIHDKKAMSDLVITKLSHHTAPATGGREVILLCDRIAKDDIQIRFYEERNGEVIWESYTDISPTDVHKQVAICFRTPKYHNEHIAQPVMARIQLRRISDNQISEPRNFQFLPCESDEDIISRKRRKIQQFTMNHSALDSIFQTNQQEHQQQPQMQHVQQQQQQPSTSAQVNQQQLFNKTLQPNSQACMIVQQQPQTHHQVQQQQQQLQPPRPQPQPRRATVEMRVPTGSPQSQRVSPVPMIHHQQQQAIQSPDTLGVLNGSSTRSPNQTPSPTHKYPIQQQQQHHHNQQQDNYLTMKTQNLIVRGEIIDNDGTVMQLVDRPDSDQQQMVNTEDSNNPNNRPLDSSLDRIRISQLMPDMTFNQNFDI